MIEQRADELNGLLEQGREWAAQVEADALLVIFADLPLLDPRNIEEMQVLAGEDGTIVLAPDRHHTGTNAMLARPPQAARFAFGVGSLARHKALAAEAGLRVLEYESTGTSFDVDTPGDLALMGGQRLTGTGMPAIPGSNGTKRNGSLPQDQKSGAGVLEQ